MNERKTRVSSQGYRVIINTSIMCEHDGGIQVHKAGGRGRIVARGKRCGVSLPRILGVASV